MGSTQGIPSGDQGPATAAALTSAEFHAFAEVFEASDWDELELLVDGLDLRLRRTALGVSSRLTLAVAPALPPAVICAPHLGTFRARAVDGQSVVAGAVVGELRVMRRTVAIVSPTAATIVAVHARDGSLVECGEVLFFVEPGTAAAGGASS